MVKEIRVTYILCIHGIHNFLLIIFNIARLHSSLVSFVKLSEISKRFPSIFIEKNPQISVLAQFRSVQLRVNCVVFIRME